MPWTPPAVDADGDAEPITISDIATFGPYPPGSAMQPNQWMIVGLDTNFHSTASAHTVDGTLFGGTAQVRFTSEGQDFSMSTKNTNIIIAFCDAFNACDLPAFDEILAPGWINHPADPGHENTPEGFAGGVQDFHDALENFQLTRDAIVSEDDLVVCRITMTGRHVKALGPWQPNGEHITLHGMDMHRLEQGRIAETWHFERMGTK